MTVQSAGSKVQKGYKGIAMEGLIATWYARTTRSRIEEQRALALRIAERVPPDGHVLEVAPGPGYLSIELAKLGKCEVTGLDISESFVAIERKNAAQAGITVDFNHGDATTMPFEANRFDFVVCVAAFKNFTQPVKVINEFHRVLNDGGTALIYDLRRDASREAIDAEVNHMKLNPLNALMTRWTFQQMLLKSAYTQSEIETLVIRTNFKNCTIQIDQIGMEIWLEKRPASATDN